MVHQRHAEFQQLLLAERKIPRQQSALGVQAHELENGICLFLNLGRKTGEHLGQSLTGMRHADLHILDAGHLAVDACLLKGSQQSESRDLWHLQVRDLLAFKLDGAGIDRVVPHYRVE